MPWFPVVGVLAQLALWFGTPRLLDGLVLFCDMAHIAWHGGPGPSGVVKPNLPVWNSGHLVPESLGIYY